MRSEGAASGGWIRSVELRVRSLEAQQVPVGAGGAPARQVLVGALAEAERHGERRLGLDAADDLRHRFRRDAVIFAGLQHHRAVSVIHRLADAAEDFLRSHPVARQRLMAGPQPAVSAVADAAVRDFDQPAQMDLVADVPPAGFIREPIELLEARRALFAKPQDDIAFLHSCRSSPDAVRAGCRLQHDRECASFARPAGDADAGRDRGRPVSGQSRARARCRGCAASCRSGRGRNR